MTKLAKLSASLLSWATLSAYMNMGFTCVSAELIRGERFLLETSIPSIAPSGECEEDEEDVFLLKKGRRWVWKGNCGWLSKRKKKYIEKVCKYEESYEDLLPAKDVCKETCGICTKPTPSPVSRPPGCYEEPEDKFCLKKFRRGRCWVKDCEFLSKRHEKSKNWICSKEDRNDEYAPASEVCVETCDTCTSPTVSPAPSAGPVLCEEDEDDEFYYRKSWGGDIETKTCGWLDDQRDWNIKWICKSNQSGGGYEPAKDVCVETCKSCEED